MRSQIIVLLAVLTNHATAGLVRHRGAYVQHDKFPRFYNTSSIPPSSNDLESSTTSSIPFSSNSIESITSGASLSESIHVSTPTRTLSPATSQSDENAAAVKSQTSPTATSQSAAYPTSFTTPYASSTSVILSDSESVTASKVPYTNQQNSQSATTNPLDSTSSHSGNSNGGIGSTTPRPALTSAESSIYTSTGSPLPISSSVVATSAFSQSYSKPTSQTSSYSPVDKAAVVQFGASQSGEFAPVTPSPAAATSTPAGIQYPNAQSGNKAMASGFNQIFATLNETSPCDVNDNNQVIACVSGQPAQCEPNQSGPGNYVLKSCPDGQSCYALPKPSGSTGISVECAIPSDAAAQLSGEANAGGGASVASKQSTALQSTTAPINGNPQSTSDALPKTESIQIPVQRLSSTPQEALTSQNQASTNTAKLNAVPSSAAQQEASSTSSRVTSPAPTPNQDVYGSFVSTTAAAAAQTAATAEGEPIFSLPGITSPASQTPNEGQLVQPTASTSFSQGPSTSSPSPSVLAEQQPAPSTETSLAPAPHFPQAAPEVQPSSQPAAATLPDQASTGAAIFSVESPGSQSSSSDPGTNEKIAVAKPNETPIYSYITVTVTTTAHDGGPTA